MSLDSAMSENYPASNTSNELMLVKIDAKLDRMADKMERYEHDTQAIRQRLHDIANEVQIMVTLNLPARIQQADKEKADFDSRVTALENIEQRRAGAAQLVKVLWAIGGAVGVGGAAAILNLFNGG